MEYQNFTLRLRDLADGSAADRAFKVEVIDSPVGQMREAATVSYRAAEFTSALNRLERKRIKQAELITLGEALAKLLFPEQIREMLRASMARLGQEERLRLRLTINDPILVNLPWEYAYLDRSFRGQDEREKGLNGFLALDPQISLVRHEALEHPVAAITAPPPLKLVVGLASPTDVEHLDLEQERDYIVDALSQVDGITADIVEHLTVAKFEQSIQGAQIFHFAGHGTFARQSDSAEATRHAKVVAIHKEENATGGHRDPVGTGELLFEDDQGRSYLFAADKLAQNLSTARLVVLGACESGRRDGINVWSGVAPALIRAGVPATVAMQYTVYDESAIAFSRRFYQAIGSGLSLDAAVSAGRLAVLNLEAPYDLDFGVPVFYLRATNSVVMAEQTTDASLVAQRTAVTGMLAERIHELHGDIVHGNKTVINTAINTGGGAYIGGQVTVGGDLVRRNKVAYGDTIYGDKVSGDKIMGDKVAGDKVGGARISVGDITGSSGVAIGRNARATVTHGDADAMTARIEELFAPIYPRIRQGPQPQPIQEVIRQQVTMIEAELHRGQRANRQVLESAMTVLQTLAADIAVLVTEAQQQISD